MSFFDAFDMSGAILPGAIVMVLIALLAIGIPDLLSRRGRQSKAQGTVFDNIKSASEKGGESFTPKVRFATADGRQIEFTDGFGASSTPKPVGTAVSVIYSAENPERAFVPHPGKRIVAYVILFGFLVLLTVLWALR